MPALPELPAGQLIVQRTTWSRLLNYVIAQTSTINALTQALQELSNLHDTQFTNIQERVNRLDSELSEIAQALEGVYEND